MLRRREFTNTETSQIRVERSKQGYLKAHTKQINKDLVDLGAVGYDMVLPETKILPLIIHPEERITGIVYGRYRQENDKLYGRGALVATSKRVLMIDKKPLSIREDEITYDIISGVTYSKVGFAGTVTLHTREGNIKVRTFNQHCAKFFVGAIEAHIFYHNTLEKETS